MKEQHQFPSAARAIRLLIGRILMLGAATFVGVAVVAALHKGANTELSGLTVFIVALAGICAVGIVGKLIMNSAKKHPLIEIDSSVGRVRVLGHDYQEEYFLNSLKTVGVAWGGVPFVEVVFQSSAAFAAIQFVVTLNPLSGKSREAAKQLAQLRDRLQTSAH